MKTIKLLIFICLTVLVTSCCKDSIKSTEFEFTPAFLEQTRWKGTLEEINIPMRPKEISKSKVGIIFVSDKKAGYSILFDNGTGEAAESNFEYTIKEKIMNIRNGYRLSGIWFLIHFDGKKMILEQGNSGEGAYKATLELNRIE